MRHNNLKTTVIGVVAALVLMLVLGSCGFPSERIGNQQPDRFVEVYNQNGHAWNHSTIYMDTETGVLYYLQKDGYGAGLSVLYDADGNIARGKQE